MTVGALLREAVREVTDVDSKLLATLRALVFAPGKVTLDYLDGKRERYVTPVKLYLMVSAVFFFLAWKVYMTPEVLVAQMKSTPQFASITKASAEAQSRLLPQLIDTSAEWNAWLRFSGVLVFAAIMKLLLVRRRQLYVQHLIFALHYYAFDFLFYTVFALPLYAYGQMSGTPPSQGWISASYLVLVAYLFFAVRRAYALSNGKAGLVALGAFVGDVIVTVLAGGIAMAIAFALVL